MTQLRLVPALALDIERITRHLVMHDVDGIEGRIDEIFGALMILMTHPHIGRPSVAGQRELVIGQGARGYVALYRYDEPDDAVVVMALRSQREAGFVDR